MKTILFVDDKATIGTVLQVYLGQENNLVYVEDPSIKVTVVDDRHIQYGNETTSLSALAQRIKGFDHPVQGTLWFMYQGRILNDIRESMGK